MEKENKIMVDIETLGLTPGCAILSIGATVFDHPGRQSYERDLHVKIDLPSQVLLGLRVEPETAEWWRNQPRMTWKSETEFPVPLEKALNTFEDFLLQFEPYTIWASGNFDIPIIDAAYRAAGKVSPIPYNRVGCYRTLRMLDPTSKKPARNGNEIAHTALGDARYQGRIAKEILLRLSDRLKD